MYVFVKIRLMWCFIYPIKQKLLLFIHLLSGRINASFNDNQKLLFFDKWIIIFRVKKTKIQQQ